MKKLSEYWIPFWNSLVYRFWAWRAMRRQYNAKHFRQCQKVGGGGILLGSMNRMQAIAAVTALKGGPIIHIDDEHHIVFYGHPPQAPAPGRKK